MLRCITNSILNENTEEIDRKYVLLDQDYILETSYMSVC